MKADIRNFNRKPIRGRTIVVLPDGSRLAGSAKDLSLGGMAMLLPRQVAVGLICTTALETVLDGRVVHFIAQAKVVYSILSGTEGFRIGLLFTQVDAENNKILSDLML